jgi:hypothetical protein
MFKQAVLAYEDEVSSNHYTKDVFQFLTLQLGQRQPTGRGQQSNSPEDSIEEASEAEDDDQSPSDEKLPEQGTQHSEHREMVCVVHLPPCSKNDPI